MLKKVSSVLGFLFLPRLYREPLAAGRGLFSALSQAWCLFQDTCASQAAINKATGPELWAASVAWRGTTPLIVSSRVRSFQLMALVSVTFGSYGLYGALTGSPLIGSGCSALASIYYLQAALRLYQIRNQSLCSLTVFVTAVAENPVELLPRGLPPGWHLIRSSNMPVVRA